MSYQPVYGWKLTPQKDAKGIVTSITFEAEGQGILPGQFQQFVFVAKNPDQGEDAAWDAYQYYKDGTIVEWTGGEKDKTPHSITKIVKADSTSTNHHAASTMAKKEVVKASKKHSSSPSNLPLTLSIVSILLALCSFVLNMKKRVR